MRQMTDMERRKDELEAKLAEADEPPPLLHPSLAEVYRERVDALSQAPATPGHTGGSGRGDPILVSAIELVPEGGGLAIVLRGDLAPMLSFAADKTKPGAQGLRPAIAGIVGCGDAIPS
jgi:site-specific DNA recombinase